MSCSLCPLFFCMAGCKVAFTGLSAVLHKYWKRHILDKIHNYVASEESSIHHCADKFALIALYDGPIQSLASTLLDLHP